MVPVLVVSRNRDILHALQLQIPNMVAHLTLGPLLFATLSADGSGDEEAATWRVMGAGASTSQGAHVSRRMHHSFRSQVVRDTDTYTRRSGSPEPQRLSFTQRLTLSLGVRVVPV